MVSSGKPEGGTPVLPSPAGKNILNGIVEHMAHSEHTRNIGWWDDDGVSGLILINLSGEGSVFFPFFVESVLYFFRLVCFFHVLS